MTMIITISNDSESANNINGDYDNIDDNNVNNNNVKMIMVLISMSILTTTPYQM